ncbi:MAG: nitrous oxide reductase family maturation protein NosD [Siculibacillus sp.]
MRRGTRGKGTRAHVGAIAAAVAMVLGAIALVGVDAPATTSAPRASVAARPLQPLIDATPTGATLELAPGLYAGPATVARTMTLRGMPGAVIDGGGVGSILTVEADGVTVAGLAFRGSGDRHDEIDAALRLRGRHAIVKDNTIEDCLYGIELKQSDGNVLRRNRISSKALPEPDRGDGIRLWLSTGNLIEDNTVIAARDGFALQASGNRIRANTVRDGRYGALLLYANANEIAANRLEGNVVGVMAIASHDVVVRDNRIANGRHAFGNGLVFKDSSRATVIGNDLFAQAQGIWLDASPSEPEEINLFRANRIAYAGTAIGFHADLIGNVFEDNRFVGNHTEVVVRSGGGADRNTWRGNAWDAYEGFDRDGDGVGDTPFEVWAWTDRLWMDVPAAQLFRSAPSLALIDFVERLGRFTEPRLLLRDDAPRLERESRASTAEP